MSQSSETDESRSRTGRTSEKKRNHSTFMEDCCIVLLVYSCMCIFTGVVAGVYEIVNNAKATQPAKQEEVDTVTTTQPI